METKRCSGWGPGGLKPHEADISNFHKNQGICKDCMTIRNRSKSRTASSKKIMNKRVKDNQAIYEHFGYYVYYHMDGDEIVYIGKGKGDRAWVSNTRQPEHVSWIMGKAMANEQWVHIVKHGLSSEEAYEYEADLLDSADTRFNILNGQKGGM